MPTLKIDETTYRSHPAISRSELWKMNDSPEKFRFCKDHPEPASPALIFGQAVHALLLQPETFESEFAVAPAVDRRTKEGKAIYSEFVAHSIGRHVLTQEDYSAARAMVEAAHNVPLVSQLLAGEKEVSYFWKDEDTGIDCKARLDCTTDLGGSLFIIDYKTTEDASNDAFMRSVLKYGYDFQGAMYSEAVKKGAGIEPAGFILIAQEKKPPYSVNIFVLAEELLLHGYDTFRRLIGTYKLCCDTGNWWGYLGPDGNINELALPKWAKTE